MKNVLLEPRTSIFILETMAGQEGKRMQQSDILHNWSTSLVYCDKLSPFILKQGEQGAVCWGGEFNGVECLDSQQDCGGRH